MVDQRIIVAPEDPTHILWQHRSYQFIGRSPIFTMSASAATFPLFSDFPTEIRLAIWRQCLPHRVVELDNQPDDIIWDEETEEEAPPCSNNGMIQLRNKAPPLIARVCRESRQVAFETGRQLPGYPDPRDPENTQEFAQYMVANPWLDSARDVVHINWDPVADIEWQTYDWGDPVRCVMSYAEQTTMRRASIRLGLLRAMKSRVEPHDHYRWTRQQLADLMRTHSSSLDWSVVVRSPIVVHATGTTDTGGLFGLLGDAPVQLVDVHDHTKIQKFMGLNATHGITISSRIEPSELVETEQVLRDVVDVIFGSVEAAPALHPVLMFRLCREYC
ncbi:hypothetical protein KVR01_006951 [Diaporthe batatas]|uniref:uncharacterized protein n=1 Tax=Diaporthe batatas TaxID=748121 RepID=UPI001D038EEF|nr:uncharacterized protein KVR01_006951 [Diaporthe batatas]KAG8163654.1 hypothetical protein KVR01_006951 [Diaporthe batatas]